MEENKIEIKCDYCGRSEICKGSYPEGCFLENKLMKEWDKKYNDFKTPNDMSDKKTREQILAEIIYREEDNPDFTLNEVLEYIIKGDEYKEPWVDVALEAMQSYAEQHLEDVLGEAEKEKIKECEICSCQPPYTRCLGFDDALNLLKQRKG